MIAFLLGASLNNAAACAVAVRQVMLRFAGRRSPQKLPCGLWTCFLPDERRLCEIPLKRRILGHTETWEAWLRCRCGGKLLLRFVAPAEFLYSFWMPSNSLGWGKHKLLKLFCRVVGIGCCSGLPPSTYLTQRCAVETSASSQSVGSAERLYTALCSFSVAGRICLSLLHVSGNLEGVPCLLLPSSLLCTGFRSCNMSDCPSKALVWEQLQHKHLVSVCSFLSSQGETVPVLDGVPFQLLQRLACPGNVCCWTSSWYLCKTCFNCLQMYGI